MRPARPASPAMWRVNINGTLHCGRPKKILSLQFFAAAEKSQEANELYFYLAKAIKGALSSQNHHCFGLCCNNYLSIHCSKSKDSLTCISKFSPISSGSAKHDGECKTPLHTRLLFIERFEENRMFESISSVASVAVAVWQRPLTSPAHGLRNSAKPNRKL